MTSLPSNYSGAGAYTVGLGSSASSKLFKMSKAAKGASQAGPPGMGSAATLFGPMPTNEASSDTAGGAGKSVLCRRMVWEWLSEGEGLGQHYDLVLLLPIDQLSKSNGDDSKKDLAALLYRYALSGAVTEPGC